MNFSLFKQLITFLKVNAFYNSIVQLFNLVIILRTYLIVVKICFVWSKVRITKNNTVFRKSRKLCIAKSLYALKPVLTKRSNEIMRAEFILTYIIFIHFLMEKNQMNTRNKKDEAFLLPSFYLHKKGKTGWFDLKLCKMQSVQYIELLDHYVQKLSRLLWYTYEIFLQMSGKKLYFKEAQIHSWRRSSLRNQLPEAQMIRIYRC